MVKIPPRLELARLPTPIHKLERTSAELGVDLWVWRDDLTGFVLSGNKIRKLEFLLAEARAEGATALITCGGVQSNHVRATVFAGRQLGMDVSVVLREPPPGALPGLGFTGNLLLDHLAGARVRRVTWAEYETAGKVYDRFLEQEAEHLRAAGAVPYTVCEGGSSPLGCMGYFGAVEEMLGSWQRAGAPGRGPDSLFFALGSGGTHAGLALGFAHHGLDPAAVHAINVCDDRTYFEHRVGALLQGACERFDLPAFEAPLQIHDGHVGDGYGQATPEDLRFYAELASREGLLLDPCYTGKAFRGMVAELRADRERFGSTILFLHTGGVFGNFAYAEAYRAALEG